MRLEVQLRVFVPNSRTCWSHLRKAWNLKPWMKRLVTMIAKGKSETVSRSLFPSVVKYAVFKNPEVKKKETGVRSPCLQRMNQIWLFPQSLTKWCKLWKIWGHQGISSFILRQFQAYVNSCSSDRRSNESESWLFVSSFITVIGDVATIIREVAQVCLKGFIALLSNRSNDLIALRMSSSSRLRLWTENEKQGQLKTGSLTLKWSKWCRKQVWQNCRE